MNHQHRYRYSPSGRAHVPGHGQGQEGTSQGSWYQYYGHTRSTNRGGPSYPSSHRRHYYCQEHQYHHQRQQPYFNNNHNHGHIHQHHPNLPPPVRAIHPAAAMPWATLQAEDLLPRPPLSLPDGPLSAFVQGASPNDGMDPREEIPLAASLGRERFRNTTSTPTTTNSSSGLVSSGLVTGKHRDYQSSSSTTAGSPVLSSEDEKSLAVSIAKIAGPAHFDRSRCNDAVCPISQQSVDDIPEGQLLSYEEIQGDGQKVYIRAFAVDSFRQMLLQKSKQGSDHVLKHPVSQVEVPEDVIEKGREMIRLLEQAGKLSPEEDVDPASWTLAQIQNSEDPQRSIESLAMSVFQPFFSELSVDIPRESLSNMGIPLLRGLARDMRGMYFRNIEAYQRRQLCPTRQGQPFDTEEQSAMLGSAPLSATTTTLWWKFQILHGIRRAIGTETQHPPQALVRMAMYVLVGALATASPLLRNRYRDFISMDLDGQPSEEEEMGEMDSGERGDRDREAERELREERDRDLEVLGGGTAVIHREGENIYGEYWQEEEEEDDGEEDDE